MPRSIQGTFEPGFAPVVQMLQDMLQQPEQRGAALCVYQHGQRVIDVWAGVVDRAGRQPWQGDTLVNVFSSGKPVLAVVVLQLVAEGRLQLDAPVSSYWPEFAQAGKQAITLRQLLSHRSGLSAIGEPLPPAALFDWQRMVQALEQQQPWWTPGKAHGYAPMTYGWLLGELVRRVDGCMPGAAIAQRIAGPLGLEFYVGLGEAQLKRVSDVSRIKTVLALRPQNCPHPSGRQERRETLTRSSVLQRSWSLAAQMQVSRQRFSACALRSIMT